ncbi:Cytosolic Fe-S cluster assembly factor nubp1-A [Aduncisulcus paluster]|uniref:Cytosolic Fe-S cluster assembly factor nubp1-A n=1 Tax=Aduncisulcus paluster TaxID=2918883 RepID=A0ABQ5JTM5_9EUKA|nr:Cytosolic Fe-S cluster assembly factor nubp1-A [Aduncisulcus paluster]|eukprot:gnl/Carplike_NY0171/1021_a1399_1955.p1 GENE.gnl/Carplike_NY0171/1021_a1399_1955~~gnl/Carplike_NY0171/1021_a1399_1955.p1  ORF type:complete len:313 (+),score=110.96 gnl/Carplike_NY0171/1021_a1399_1955:58-996(+)
MSCSGNCSTCPHRGSCSSGGSVDPDLAQITECMSKIKNIVLVLSGKGGVGKSAVACQMAFALAGRGKQVGLLDVDVCGPSVPTITGTTASSVHSAGKGWEPVVCDVGDGEGSLSIMSIGFLLPSPDDAVIWRGPRKVSLIKNFLKDVAWGELDYLVIDTPPGSSDEHLSIVSFLKSVGISGAVLVTQPQEVSLSDVRKEVDFCRRTAIPILGLIENMSGFVCPCCGEETIVFHPSAGGGEKLCLDAKIRFLGRIPLDPSLTIACDSGRRWEGVVMEKEDKKRAEGKEDKSISVGWKRFCGIVDELEKIVSEK